MQVGVRQRQVAAAKRQLREVRFEDHRLQRRQALPELEQLPDQRRARQLRLPLHAELRRQEQVRVREGRHRMVGGHRRGSRV